MPLKPEGRAQDRKPRPGNTPVEQQERDPKATAETRHEQLSISGEGAADFLTASGGLDLPETGVGKGMGQTRDEGILSDPRRLTPRLGPDDEAMPGERRGEEQMTGSQTGTIGGGGPEAHNPSPVRATGVDDPTAGKND
jgi:hypothetical protein